MSANCHTFINIQFSITANYINNTERFSLSDAIEDQLFIKEPDACTVIAEAFINKRLQYNIHEQYREGKVSEYNVQIWGVIAEDDLSEKEFRRYIEDALNNREVITGVFSMQVDAWGKHLKGLTFIHHKTFEPVNLKQIQ